VTLKELVRSYPDGEQVLRVDLNSDFYRAAAEMAPYLGCSLVDAAHAMHTQYLRWPSRLFKHSVRSVGEHEYDKGWLGHVVACIKAGQMRLQDGELIEVQSSCWLPGG
jgi:hypothetical protein